MWIDGKGQVRRGRRKKQETYLTDYIAEYYDASDLLGLPADCNISEKEINERYRSIISKIHPDNWANENDPELWRRSSEQVILFTNARDVLVKRNRPQNH